MTEPIDIDPLVGEALKQGGKLSFATLVAHFVSLEAIREVARKHGLTPKGGFRIERAPARILAPLIAESKDAEVVRDAWRAVVAAIAPSHPETAKADEGALAGLESVLRLKEQELDQLRVTLESKDDQATRQREKETELSRKLQLEIEKGARQYSEIEDLQRQAAVTPGSDVGSSDQRRVIHELERDLETLGEAESGLRRLLALRAARISDLEAEVTDLETKVPKSRRRKAPKPEAPPLSDGFRLPHFTPAFDKSLEGKDRRSVEKAIQSSLLFCTEGPSYPGLEVKQMEGQELWSLRASLKLRVYFQIREDGDVDFLALADREDQNTLLRRFKER